MPDFPPRQYVAPRSPIGIVRQERGERHFTLVLWGFIPAWMTEVKPNSPIINIRAETVLGKPTYQNAMKRRRCLIPADGFYKWHGETKGSKQAYLIRRDDNGPVAFAGLWEHWIGADGSELETAAIITVAANRQIARIDDRMPAMIDTGDFAVWLDNENVTANDAAKLIKPAADGYFVLEPTRIERRAPFSKPQMGLL
jgi:putative SOS response-associated peptidase YedK